MALTAGDWLVTCESRLYWCSPTLLKVVSGRAPSLTLGIFDGIEASIPVAKGGPSGEVRFEGETKSQHGIATKGSVEHQMLKVFLPKTRLNVKIAAPGYSPVFQWGVTPKDLERVGVRFSTGASI